MEEILQLKSSIDDIEQAIKILQEQLTEEKRKLVKYKTELNQKIFNLKLEEDQLLKYKEQLYILTYDSEVEYLTVKELTIKEIN